MGLLGRSAAPLGSHPGGQGHVVVQHIAECPGMVGQPRCHGWRPLPPLPPAPGWSRDAEAVMRPAQVCDTFRLNMNDDNGRKALSSVLWGWRAS